MKFCITFYFFNQSMYMYTYYIITGNVAIYCEKNNMYEIEYKVKKKLCLYKFLTCQKHTCHFFSLNSVCHSNQTTTSFTLIVRKKM